MINLFYNLYLTDNRIRNSEILQALNHSVSNEKIDKIYLMSTTDLYESVKYMSNKFIFIEKINIPTYQYVINLIEEYTSDTDINIMINSDCYFDKETFHLINELKDDEAWCLTRWDYDKKNKESIFRDSKYSQDAWIIKGKPKEFGNIYFSFGRVGCDNRIAYELQEAGYEVKNPSKSIKLIHLHDSNLRTFGHDYCTREHNRIRGEYLFVEPTK